MNNIKEVSKSVFEGVYERGLLITHRNRAEIGVILEYYLVFTRSNRYMHQCTMLIYL